MWWQRWAIVAAVLLAAAVLPACSDDSGYQWTARPEEERAVGTAREMDGQIAGVWKSYSDGLLLHYILEFCAGLGGADDVAGYLDEKAAEQGEAVILPVVVGSPYLCPAEREAVGQWIAEKAGGG